MKKISESFASSKISDNSYSSGKLSSGSGLAGQLDNFDYKFSSAKLSDSRSSGMFSSTPKYADTSSTSSYLSRSVLHFILHSHFYQSYKTLSQDGFQLDVQ